MTELLTPDEAAAMLGVPRSRVLAMVRGRALGAVRLGPRTVRIPRDAIERLVAEAYHPPQDEEAQGARQRPGQRLPRRGEASLVDALAGALLGADESGWRDEIEEGYHPLNAHHEWWGSPREYASAILADPAFREALTDGLATAMRAAAERTDMDDPTTVGREKHLEWASAIVDQLLTAEPTADHD